MNVEKMNTHCIKSQLAADFVHYGAKYSAFWCKIQCILVLNAVHYGAKYSAFWC